MSSIPTGKFKIAARTRTGAVSTFQVSAADAPSAVRIAERDGLRVLSCEAQSARLSSRPARTRMAAAARFDVALFAHEMASLLDAGLGIVEAIETLVERQRGSQTGPILDAVVARLKEGQSLSAAMSGFTEVFPPLLVASIAASEHTGNMATALQRYAANFEALRALRAKALSAAVYPLTLLAVGALVVLFLLAFVVPRFSRLIASAHGEIPFASRLLLGLGNAIDTHPQLALGVLAGVAAGAGVAFMRAAAAGWNLSFMQRLPLVGGLVRTFRHTQFYRTAGMLVEGGIPAVRAFEMAGTMLAPDDRQRLAAALASIREGVPLGRALQQAGLADAVALRMLAVAARTGQLAALLGRIATFQELALARAIDVAARLFEPALMLAIGLVIGAIVVLMYLPIFDLASSLQ